MAAKGLPFTKNPAPLERQIGKVEKKSFKKTELSALEISTDILAFVKELKSHGFKQKETIAALKQKINDLAAENKKLSDELEKTKKRRRLFIEKPMARR